MNDEGLSILLRCQGQSVNTNSAPSFWRGPAESSQPHRRWLPVQKILQLVHHPVKILVCPALLVNLGN